MSDELPRRRTLESLKKEAKQWLDALRRNSPAARTRFEQALASAPASPTLRDVQHALARELGFPGWAELRRQLELAASAGAQARHEYDAMADALLEAYRTGTPAAMERHWALTWHRRPWSGMRAYVQLDLGREAGSPNLDDDITLDDARYLVAREHGFEHWDALLRHCATRSSVPTTPSLHLLAADSGGRMTDTLLGEIADLEEITVLRLAGSRGVTDAGMRHLTRMPQLTHVDLSGTSVTDAGVTFLAKHAQLREVNLQWTATGDGAVRALAGKPLLTHFRSGNLVTDSGLALFHEYPQFTSWHGGEQVMALTSYEAGPNYLLLRGPFTDRGMHQLATLQGLFALNIDAAEPDTTPAALASLEALPHLGWLACVATDASMAHISRMPHLRFLACQDTTTGDDGFEALSASRSIEYIWGRRSHNLGSRGFRALARIPTLKGLSVSCLNVDDGAIATLASFPALRELMPVDVPDAGYRHIARCDHLESLILMYCRETTDVATEYIAALPMLRKYFASYTRVTDRTPELLSTMDSLEEITFDSCAALTDAGIGRLARLPHLRTLRISGRHITPAITSMFPVGVQVDWST